MTRKQPNEEPNIGTKQKSSALTISQINADRLTLLANQYWAPQISDSHLPYDAKIIDVIYYKEISKSDFSIRRIMMLEFSQYLKNYLWPNYKHKVSTHAHMSIVVMLNEKFRERVDAWAVFNSDPSEFTDFFQQVLEACLLKKPLTTIGYLREQTALLLFLNHCFNSLEVQLCRNQAKRLVSLSMWASLQPSKRREHEFKTFSEWRKLWKKLQKRDQPNLNEKLHWERHFLQKLMVKFMEILESIPKDDFVSEEVVRYCERFSELLIDLEALLSTRRFFNTVLDDCHLVVRCSLAPLRNREEGKLFSQSGQFSEDMIPTVGFNMRKITKGNVTIKVWDIGGQPRFGSMWERYCRGVNAIVYMVDAADLDKMEASRNELHSLLDKPHLNGIPVLVLGNKRDLPGALDETGLIERMNLSSIQDREICCYSISCKAKDNIDITLQWLVAHSKSQTH